MDESKIINLGVIGGGYWGPNLIRNFSSLTNCKVSMVSDLKQGRIEFIRKEFPFVSTTTNYKDILKNPEINAVCIVTPVKTHSTIAVEALNEGKHVFIEKPMASSVS